MATTTTSTPNVNVIKLRNVRLAFPQLFTPKAVKAGDTPSFSALFLIEPTDPQVAEIKKAMAAAAKTKWGEKAAEVIKSLTAGDRLCLHNGDAKSDYQGFPGMLFVSSRTKTKPLVLDADKSILDERAGRPYSGCYVVASLDIFAQDNEFGKRINAGLRGVQFLRDGDAFAGGAPASLDEFDDMSSGAGAGDMENSAADDLTDFL